MTTYPGVMGYRDGQNRARFKLIGDPDEKSFATAAQAYRAGRDRNAGLAPAKGTTVPAKASMPASRAKSSEAAITAYQHQVAVTAAVERERTRVAAVFASDASRGRERDAATLLTRTTYSAEAITKFLAEEAGPKQAASKLSPAAAAHAESVWDHANAAVASEKARVAGQEKDRQPSAQSADDVWSRAYASAQEQAS